MKTYNIVYRHIQNGVIRYMENSTFEQIWQEFAGDDEGDISGDAAIEIQTMLENGEDIQFSTRYIIKLDD